MFSARKKFLRYLIEVSAAKIIQRYFRMYTVRKNTILQIQLKQQQSQLLKYKQREEQKKQDKLKQLEQYLEKKKKLEKVKKQKLFQYQKEHVNYLHSNSRKHLPNPLEQSTKTLYNNYQYNPNRNQQEWLSCQQNQREYTKQLEKDYNYENLIQNIQAQEKKQLTKIRSQKIQQQNQIYTKQNSFSFRQIIGDTLKFSLSESNDHANNHLFNILHKQPSMKNNL